MQIDDLIHSKHTGRVVASLGNYVQNGAGKLTTLQLAAKMYERARDPELRRSAAMAAGELLIAFAHIYETTGQVARDESAANAWMSEQWARGTPFGAEISNYLHVRLLPRDFRVSPSEASGAAGMTPRHWRRLAESGRVDARKNCLDTWQIRAESIINHLLEDT